MRWPWMCLCTYVDAEAGAGRRSEMEGQLPYRYGGGRPTLELAYHLHTCVLRSSSFVLCLGQQVFAA